MTRLNRRSFLKSSIALAGGTFAISGTKSSGNILGANDRVRVAVAGLHGRGKSHMSAFAEMKDVEVVFLVDPDTTQFAAAVQRVNATAGNTPQTVQDIRLALEDKNLDAVSIATPNHWHSLMTIWSCQAGKDVYVEKPMSHNIHEGRIAVEAARKYGRVVQHGTQQRSSSSRAGEIAAVHSGTYGKLLVSKGYCCKPRWSIGFKETEPAPSSLDFNIWLGPAAEQPFHRNLVHYNWHWFWDFGNGDTGNQGVHEMDVARWAIKDGTLPKRVFSLGGRFAYKDEGQTPNTQLTVYDYGETLLLFETRGLVGKNDIPRKVQNEYYTTEGMITQGKFFPKGSGSAEPLAKFDNDVKPGGPFGSFINAVRSRNVSDLNADVEIGHYSSALCHLGNISYRLGTTEKWDGKAKAYGSNEQVAEAMGILAENLKGVGSPLEGQHYRLGRVLDFDPQTERFPNDSQANLLLTRNYRQPFTVPEKLV